MSRPSVFISYSHKDEKEKNELLVYLGVLRGAGLVDLWSDDRIGAGSDWEHKINEAMVDAKVAILLISANFLTSEFILSKEVPALLAHRQSKGLTIFPIIAKQCPWKKIDWLTKMNVRPKNGLPVWGDAGSHVDEDLTAIAYEVADIVSSKTAGLADVESEKERATRAASETPTPLLHLFIVTPDGLRYETQVSPDVQVAQLQSDFLAAWSAPPDARFVRHTLRLKPDAYPVDATLTLAEAGIKSEMDLYLAGEEVLPTSPVGLIIEDGEGRRYITNVLLSTPIKKLAFAFMDNLGLSAKEVAVELLADPTGARRRRLLRDEATLYEEHIDNGSRLRVLLPS
jgi:hypothetical protein